MSALLISLPLHSHASPTTEQPQEKEPPIISLEEGQEAPFEGLLITPARASKLYSKIELCEKDKKIAKEHFENSTLIQAAAHKQEVDNLSSALKKAEEAAQRSWYEDPGLWFTTGSVLGAVVGIASTVGLVWLAAQVRIEVPVGEN